MIYFWVLAVFVAAAALDYASARYQRELALRRPHAAGLWSVAMCLIGCVGYLSVIDVSRLLIIPECIGLYVGTLIAVRRV